MAKSESTKIEFGYFHDYESEQFAFYRIPKVLFTDEYFRNLSSDAKVLYGLMLDRMALSIRNNWVDNEGKVYIIFTLEQVMEYMNCGKDKGVKILAELDTDKGIGLIERVKRGLGKPTIIYVKSFVYRKEKVLDSAENDNRSQEVGKAEVKSSEKPKSGVLESRSQEFGKTEVQKSEKPTLIILIIIALLCRLRRQDVCPPHQQWQADFSIYLFQLYQSSVWGTMPYPTPYQ